MTDIAMGLDRDEAAAVMSVLLAEITAGAGVFDADRRLRAASPVLASMLGLPASLTRAGAELSAILDHAAATGLVTEPPDTLALFAATAGGLVRWTGSSGRHLELTVRPLGNGMRLGLWRDVTHEEPSRTRDERALLQSIIDNVSDGIVVCEPNLDLILFNAASSTTPEFPDDELRGFRNLKDTYRWHFEHGGMERTHATIEEDIEARVAPFRTGQPFSRTRQRPEGRWFKSDWKPLPDGRWLMIHSDVTDTLRHDMELRAAGEAVRQEGERLRTILDNMTDGVMLYDREGVCVYANKSFYRVQESSPERIERLKTFPNMMDALMERGSITPEFRAAALERFRVADGTPKLRPSSDGRWSEGAFHRLLDGGTLGVFRDVTDFIRNEQDLRDARAGAELQRDAAETARAEAEAANQAKSTFLAAMSHEIRTPMNGVLGMMELLERTALSDEQTRHVGIMRDSAQSLLRIIDDILDFSKIDAGRMDLENLPFSLHGLIAGTVDTFTPQARRKNLALFADPPGAGPDWLDGDPTRVRQILFNLIANALKFTDRGFVRVSAASVVEAGGARVTLTVEDSGIGMDAAQQARLFQPFSQADTSTTRRFGGTGLGLSIVRRLAELMDGTAIVESTQGRGSRFIVTLRFGLAAATGPEPATPAPSRIATGTDRPRLLVADDHPVNREVIQQQLAVLGLSVDLAADGREALALWRRYHHGVVLLDIHMPELDGFDVARAIRREEAAAGVPRTGLIAVTANALKGEDERCFAAGMDGFVAKPISLDALSRALSRFVSGLGETGGAAFDPETLRGLFGSDPARLSRLFETFVEAAAGDLATLRAADTAIARAEAAHRLKGAARMVGARLLADLASRVEAAARAGDTAATLAASEGLAAMLDETTRTARASFMIGENNG